MSKLLKRDAVQKYTLGVLYEPGVVDSQGDYADAPEIQKACWAFNRELLGGQALVKSLIGAIVNVADGGTVEVEITADPLDKGMLGIQHEDWSDDNGVIIESYLAPVDFEIPQPDGSIEKIAKGTWLQGMIWGDAAWLKVEKGEITGLSLGGSAIRIKE